MSKGSTPKAPDYSALAQQQAGLDRQTALDITNMNRINQVDPYGQTTFQTTYNPQQQAAIDKATFLLNNYKEAVPQHPNWAPDLVQKQIQQYESDLAGLKGQGTTTQQTTLNPAQQALLDQKVGLQGQQNTRIGQLLSSFQTPTAPTLGQGFDLAPERQLQSYDLAPQRQLKEANQNDIQNLLYGQITKQYGDRFAKEEAAQRAQLANQGFQMGSEGYQNTLQDFNRNKNSAYQDAATQAALSSYDQLNKERQLNQSEYGALSSDDLARFGALNSNALGQYGALSSNDLNRYSAQNSNELNRYNAGLSGYNSQMGYLSQLLGGDQGPTNPQYPSYAQATQYQSPDILGAAQQQYQANVGNANAKNAAKGQTMSTVGTIGTAAAVAF